VLLLCLRARFALVFAVLDRLLNQPQQSQLANSRPFRIALGEIENYALIC
jgi:hypothetical protein